MVSNPHHYCPPNYLMLVIFCGAMLLHLIPSRCRHDVILISNDHNLCFVIGSVATCIFCFFLLLLLYHVCNQSSCRQVLELDDAILLDFFWVRVHLRSHFDHSPLNWFCPVQYFHLNLSKLFWIRQLYVHELTPFDYKLHYQSRVPQIFSLIST